MYCECTAPLSTQLCDATCAADTAESTANNNTHKLGVCSQETGIWLCSFSIQVVYTKGQKLRRCCDHRYMDVTDQVFFANIMSQIWLNSAMDGCYILDINNTKITNSQLWADSCYHCYLIHMYCRQAFITCQQSSNKCLLLPICYHPPVIIMSKLAVSHIAVILTVHVWYLCYLHLLHDPCHSSVMWNSTFYIFPPVTPTSQMVWHLIRLENEYSSTL